jgi:hypothetical protein
MSLITDAISAEIAGLSRVATTPDDADLGYGRDLSCITELDSRLTEVDPFSEQGILESSLRRLGTDRGSMPDDESYGYNLISRLNRGITTSELQETAGLARAELLKDDRLNDVRVTVIPTDDRGSFDVSLDFFPVDPAVGNFSHTFPVKDGSRMVEALA